MSREILGTVKVEFCVYGFQLVAVLKIIKAARIYKVIIFGLSSFAVTLGIGKAFKTYSVIFGSFLKLIYLVFIIGFRLFNAVFLQYLMSMDKPCEICIFICIIYNNLCIVYAPVNIILSNVFIIINKVGNDLCNLSPGICFLSRCCCDLNSLGIMVCKSDGSFSAVTAYAELLL